MKVTNDQLCSSNGNETRKSFHAKQANSIFTACDDAMFTFSRVGFGKDNGRN
jgi:hypothetical protein